MKAKWSWCDWCMSITIYYSCCGASACTGAGCGSDLEKAEHKEYLLRNLLGKYPNGLVPDNPQKNHDIIANRIFGSSTEGNK